MEKDLKTEISIEEIDFSVKLNGNADRIDKLNGQLRIIDYKTGKVELSELQTDDMEKLIREKKFHKGFQLYLYAYMYQQIYPEQELLETGIVSFRSLKKGFLPAGFKEDGKVNKLLNSDLLGDFEKEFKELLKEIFNPNIPFEHKNRKEPCLSLIHI